MRKFLSILTMLMLVSLLALAQTRRITGRVVDNAGNPVSGASVKIKGRASGVSADPDGNFIISASTGDVLNITSVGYSSASVTVGTGSEVSVSLTRTSQSLSEVVVTTALGLRRQAKQLGYSTATLNNQELTQARVVNVASGLSGKVSGVDIRLTDNSVNPQVKITFRGSRSITGNNTALVIVDGNPVDQSFIATLNPDDIDNVSILKGPNAAALYGKEASNGVMIITTKHGTRSPGLTVNYKNSTMAELVAYMPKLQTQYSPYGGEGPGYNNPSANGGCIGCVSYIDPLTGQPLPVPFENQNYGPAYSSKDFPFSQIAIGGPDSVGNIKYGPYAAVKNGRRNFFQTGLTEQNDLSVSKGGKVGTFFISGQNVINKGVVYRDKYTRNTITGNGTLTFGGFSASGGVSYSAQNVDQAGLSYTGQNQYRPVYWNVINQPPNLNLADFKDVNGDYFSSFAGYINGYYPNPWIQVYNSRVKETNHNLITNLKLDYKVLDWLNLTVRGGYNKRSRNMPAHIDSTVFPTYSYGPFANSPTRDPWASGGTAASNSTLPYQTELVKTTLEDMNADAFLTVRRSVNKFDFTFIPGVNYRASNSNGYWYSNQVTTPMAIPNGFTKVTNPDGSAYENLSYKYRSQSAYGDLTVGFENWAFIHGSFRNDWISTLFPSTRSFNYYGVDASLVLSDKIDAIKGSNISFLKIRGGYAVTGNVNIGFPYTGFGFLGGGFIPNFGAYAIYPTAAVGSGFPYGNINGYSLSNNNVQQGLRPEKDGSAEVGFEIGFLRDRIRLEAAAYNTIATDQTLPAQTSTASGITNFTLNTGKMRSRGYELDLKLNPLVNFGKFKWNLSVNFSQIDNKVLSLLPGRDTLQLYTGTFGTTDAYSINAIVGLPYPYLLIRDFQRDPDGHIIVNAATGMPTFNPHFVAGGNSDYKYRLGFNSNMNYNRFSFNMVWDYRGGAKIMNEVGNPLDFAGISASSAENRQHFVIPNSVIYDGTKYVPNTNVPTTGSAVNWWATVYSNVAAPYLTSAAFWKLREVSIGYDIPVNKLGNFKAIKRATFSLVGQNLLMFRPSTNQWTDPEFSLNGISNAVGATNEYQTPPTRRFGFALNVTF
jgi:TonB-linked SusC/RagA family outer membrane protein